MNKKQSILVTGGAGYIGSHVANLLLDNGYNVTIIDSLITYRTIICHILSHFH